MTEQTRRKAESKPRKGKTKVSRKKVAGRVVEAAQDANGAGGDPSGGVHGVARDDGVRTYNGGTLAPMWKPGQSGNPKGRGPNPGIALVEAIAMMWEWPDSRIKKVIGDREGGGSKRVAGQMIMAMRDGDWDKTGRQPRSLQTILSFMDRWLGKVPERIELAVAKVNVPGSIDALGELMATDEAALAVLEQAVARARKRLEQKE